jgi:hypothetical protein
MEFHVQSVEDSMIDSLNFKLGNSSNYVIDRKSVAWYPTGGSEYNPRATRVLKFNITSSNAWLDPSTVMVQFKLTNTEAANALRFLNPLAANFFRRLRIIVGGVTVEDMSYYNRWYNMIHNLLPVERRMNDFATQFGLNDQHNQKDNPIDGIGFDVADTPPDIAGGEYKTVCFPLFCGLFNQTKMLPLSFMNGITVELEVVNSFTDAIAYGSESSQVWTITEPRLLADVVVLDSQVHNDYADHLRSGKTLPIAFSSFVNQVQSVGNTADPVISLSRSFTRLKSVFVSFYKPVTTVTAAGTDASLVITPTNVVDNFLGINEVNFFYHPNFIYPGPILNEYNAITDLNEEGYYKYTSKNDNVSLQLQIGSKLIPEQEIVGATQAYYHLRKALSSHTPDSPYSININDAQYRSHKFIACFDCEKVSGTAYSGINCKNSDLITIKCKNLVHKICLGRDANQPLVGSIPQFMHVNLHYDSLLILSESGVTVLE